MLDTWFSSQLWPFSTLGWPDDTEDLRFFYPNTALVTGYEILYLWVARMIMSGLSLIGDVPFRNAVIHGLVRDGHGRKMSKSLGNVIDPIEMIDRYGADALRFSLARSATGGQQDIPLSVESIEGARNFANKIWNAARLVLGALGEGSPELPPPDRRTVADRWLLSRHDACLAEVDEALDAYLFAEAAQALYRFLWSELCDWGLEVEKSRLDGAERADAAGVLAWVLERTLRMLHPTMPFVTEEIWQRFGVGESIAVAAWPERQPGLRDEAAEAAFGVVQEAVTAIRRFRALHHIGHGERFEAVVGVPVVHADEVGSLTEAVLRLAGLSSLQIVPPDGGKQAGWTTLALEDGFVNLPPGLFDAGEKRARLEAQRDKVTVLLDRSTAKLGNAGFLAKADPEVVTAEEERRASLLRQLAEIDGQLAELSGG